MTKKTTLSLETATIDTIAQLVKSNRNGTMKITTLMSRFGCSRESDDFAEFENARKVERLALDAANKHPNLKSGRSSQTLVYVSDSTLAMHTADRCWEVDTRSALRTALESFEHGSVHGDPVYDVDGCKYSVQVRADRNCRTIRVQRLNQNSDGALREAYRESAIVPSIENVLPYMRLHSQYLKDLVSLGVK